MQKKLPGLLIALLLSATAASAAETWDIGVAKLKGRVVRSLSIAHFDSNRILVGNKGGAAGSAKVIASDNGGISWRFLNQNTSLHPAATDVQAVRYLSQKIVLAGTWQHGLFRSTDGGNTFSAVNAFAPKDVRSLVSPVNQPGTVYAATGANGILKSTDYGKTWAATALDSGYFWSIRHRAGDGGVLAASSPTAGLFLSSDKGRSWDNHLQDVAVSDAAVSANSAKIIVAATDDGMYLSLDAGKQWQQPAKLKGKRLSSVQFDRMDSSVVILGGWEGGVWRYVLSDNSVKQFQAGLPVVHVDSNQRGVLLGTWGKGLHLLPRSANTQYLIDATKAGDSSVVNDLLAAFARPDVFDEVRNTALIFAARDGYLNIASSLIEAGASVNWVDGEGVTPLILAAHKNHAKLVALLLEKGADVQIVDLAGNTALDYAKRRGEGDLIYQLLLKRQAKQ